MKIQLVHQLIWVLVCPIVYKGQRIINISQADIESDTHSFSRLNQVKTFRFFGALARLRLNVSCESVESCPPSEVKDKRSYLDGPQFPPWKCLRVFWFTFAAPIWLTNHLHDWTFCRPSGYCLEVCFWVDLHVNILLLSHVAIRDFRVPPDR